MRAGFGILWLLRNFNWLQKYNMLTTNGNNYNVVDTGQIKCYDNSNEIPCPNPGEPFYGQDAQYTGNQSSYIDNGDGTESDLVTGLMWTKSPDWNEDGMINYEDKMTYKEALAFVEDLNKENYLGYNDWRLPNAKELQSIVNYTRSPDTTNSPAIDPIFECSPITNEGNQTDYPYYWTSTTHASLQSENATVYIAFGRALGWMQNRSGEYELMDVHGAGAQRSDPKSGNPSDYPHGRGPQSEVIRIYNYVRLVCTINQ